MAALVTNPFPIFLTGSIESYASSTGEALPIFNPTIPNVTHNEISQTGDPNHQRQQQFQNHTFSSTDLQGSNQEVNFSTDLTNFILQQKMKDEELATQRATNTSLLLTHRTLQAEVEKLTPTRAKMEKDNVNLDEYGRSLQMQIDNLRNLPLMVLRMRNSAMASAPTHNGIHRGGYTKSPQSGDSPQGDATSSPSTYCESSITSPVTQHGNGLMSPLTPSVINNSVHNNQINVFPNYINNNNHHQGVFDANHSHHSMFSATNALHLRGPNSVDMMPSQNHFQSSNVLNGQWGAN